MSPASFLVTNLVFSGLGLGTEYYAKKHSEENKGLELLRYLAVSVQSIASGQFLSKLGASGASLLIPSFVLGFGVFETILFYPRELKSLSNPSHSMNMIDRLDTSLAIELVQKIDTVVSVAFKAVGTLAAAAYTYSAYGFAASVIVGVAHGVASYIAHTGRPPEWDRLASMVMGQRTERYSTSGA